MAFGTIPLGDLYRGKIVTLVASLEFDARVIDNVAVELRGPQGNLADVSEAAFEKVSATELRAEFRGVVAENVSLSISHDSEEPITLKVGQLDISVYEGPWL